MERLAFSVMILLSACIATTARPGFGLDDAEEAPSPVIDLGLVPTSSPHDQALPPEPYPGFYKYLDFCTANITVDCGAEIVGALLKINEVSYGCCRDLIEMGKDCHDALMRGVASLDEYKTYASVLPQRGSEVWNYCAHAVVAPAHAAVAPTPA